MSLRGDFAKLQGLSKQMRALASNRFLEDLNKQLAEEALTQVRAGFRESRNPYGESWAPLSSREGKPLLDTARMRNSFSRQDVSPRGFRIGTNVNYVGPHQYGGKVRKGGKGKSKSRVGKIPQRAMMPIRARGIGPLWFAAFRKVSQRAQRRLLRG